MYWYTLQVNFDFPHQHRISHREQEFYFDCDGYLSLAVGDTKNCSCSNFVLLLYSKNPLEERSVRKNLLDKLEGSHKKIDLISFTQGVQLRFS